jgi:hypothetical protein
MPRHLDAGAIPLAAGCVSSFGVCDCSLLLDELHASRVSELAQNLNGPTTKKR